MTRLKENHQNETNLMLPLQHINHNCGSKKMEKIKSSSGGSLVSAGKLIAGCWVDADRMARL